MLNSKNPGIIFAEIQMMRAAFDGVHFLVEGPGDERFWRRRVNGGRVNIVACEGKKNLLGVVDKAKNSGADYIVGIYDADFDYHFGRRYHPDVLAVTDCNDLDVTLIASEALDSIIYEYGDADKIGRFEAAMGVRVVDRLQVNAAMFGLLRYLNDLEGHGVDFSKLSPGQFVEVDSWLVKVDELFDRYSQLAGVSRDVLDQLIEDKCPTPEGWNMAQGHDCLKILAIGLRCAIGVRQISEHDMAKIFRLAYTEASLKASNMYKDLEAKQQQLGYCLLN